MVLDELAKETISVIGRLCDYQVMMDEQLSPTNCAKLIEEHVRPKGDFSMFFAFIISVSIKRNL